MYHPGVIIHAARPSKDVFSLYLLLLQVSMQDGQGRFRRLNSLRKRWSVQLVLDRVGAVIRVVL
jgi:hypothetical protein